MLNKKEVSESEFWRVIKEMNVHPKPLGKYPYISSFRLWNGGERGRIEPCCPECNEGRTNRYFLYSYE